MEGCEDDLDYDFIRRPKCYHSSPRSRFPSIGNNRNDLGPFVTPSDNSSTIDSVCVHEEASEYRPINPFSGEGRAIISKEKAQKKLKRLHISDLPNSLGLNDSISSDNPQFANKISLNPRLRDINVKRLNEEYLILEEIGMCVNGWVYKCVNLLNGCIYAIKRSLHPIDSDFDEQITRNEFHAIAVLEHPNILRYYSCWMEEGYAFVQNEFCDLGTLEEYVKSNDLSEFQLHSFLLQMSKALAYIHCKGVAHMDINPGNILVKTDNDIEEDDSGFGERDDKIIFKLSGFCHTINLDEEPDVSEGDSRYLSKELLEGNYENLVKSDIFSLGLTAYEVAGGGALPESGEDWQQIRNGKLNNLEMISRELNNILKTMVDPQPKKRPSASDIVTKLQSSQSHSFQAEGSLGYMNQFHQNNSRLEHSVERNGFYIRELVRSHLQIQNQLQSGIEASGPSYKFKSFCGKRNADSNTRIVGRKTKRSKSTMF